jgi:hypothetical protein
MYFKIKASFISESHDFPKDESNILDEQRVDKGVDYLGMSVSWMLVEDNLILDKEMRDIVVEVYFL